MNEKMNINIVEANIKLQDENKILKNDNLLLERRMTSAAKHLKSKLSKFKVFELEEDIQDAIDMLEGNYVFKDKRRKEYKIKK